MIPLEWNTYLVIYNNDYKMKEMKPDKILNPTTSRIEQLPSKSMLVSAAPNDRSNS